MVKREKDKFKEIFFVVILLVFFIIILGFSLISLRYMATPIAAKNNANRLVESISQIRFYKNNINKELSSIDDFKKIMYLDPSMVKDIKYNRFIIGKKDQTMQGDFVDYSTQKITMTISTNSNQEYSVVTSPDVCTILVDKISKSSCKYRDENKTLFRVEL